MAGCGVGRRLVDGLADGGRHPADLGVRSAGRGRQPRDLQWSDAGRAGVAGRAAVGVAVGVVVGELAAVVLFSGTIDRLLDGQAAARADGHRPSRRRRRNWIRQRAARAGLDDAVDRALQLRDEALVVARCEYNPSPDCPQTHITGLPGAGPENRTANDFLADTTRQLDTATAERDRRAPALDADVAATSRRWHRPAQPQPPTRMRVWARGGPP